MLSTTVKRVYTAFFYSDTAQHLQQVEEEVLFGHFMTPLNDAFEQACTSDDIGYKSGSESMNVENHDHITFPCKKIYPSDLPPQEHAHLPAKHMQCIAD